MGAAAFVVPLILGAGQGASQRRAGIEDKHEADLAIRQEKLKAKDEQIARNEELLDELARRRAIQGAGGGTDGGSFTALQDKAIEDRDSDLTSLKAGLAVRTNSLVRRGRNSKRAGNIAAASSLVSSAGQAFG